MNRDRTASERRSKRRRGAPHERAKQFASGRVDAGMIRRALGDDIYRSLSERQRARLIRQLEIINAWYGYCAVARVGWGGIEDARTQFVEAAKAWWPWRLSARALKQWTRRLESQGIIALVDRRGRPGGARAIDAALWIEFSRRVAGGMSVPEAHALVRVKAAETGRPWLALRTIQQRLRGGQVVLFSLREPSGEGRR
ncbi:MAG: hypothetical protein ABIG44_05625 [Planctomycetota bacterium]